MVVRTRARKKLHWYHVILVTHDREDVHDSWNVTSEIVYGTWSWERAMNFVYSHQYLQTEMDDMDDGTSWLFYRDLFVFQVR